MYTFMNMKVVIPLKVHENNPNFFSDGCPFGSRSNRPGRKINEIY